MIFMSAWLLASVKPQQQFRLLPANFLSKPAPMSLLRGVQQRTFHPVMQITHTEQRCESNPSCFHVLMAPMATPPPFLKVSPTGLLWFPRSQGQLSAGPRGHSGALSPRDAGSQQLCVCLQEGQTPAGCQHCCEFQSTAQTFRYTALMKQINNSKFCPFG